ncbi:MAG TPA: hypothetical protein VII57_05220 [Dehalococcoidia bacterium]
MRTRRFDSAQGRALRQAPGRAFALAVLAVSVTAVSTTAVLGEAMGGLLVLAGVYLGVRGALAAGAGAASTSRAG